MFPFISFHAACTTLSSLGELIAVWICPFISLIQRFYSWKLHAIRHTVCLWMMALYTDWPARGHVLHDVCERRACNDERTMQSSVSTLTHDPTTLHRTASTTHHLVRPRSSPQGQHSEGDHLAEAESHLPLQRDDCSSVASQGS